MKAGRKKTFIILSVLVLGFSSPIPPDLLTYRENRLEYTSLPFRFRTLQDITSADIDRDGSDELILFDRNRVHITSTQYERSISTSDNVIEDQASSLATEWSSPDEWIVIEGLITDLNRDGDKEVVLLVWREFRPWPIDDYLLHPGRIQDFHDTDNQSCHVILIGWRNGKYQEIWAGSALADPLLSIAAADIDSDGNEELIALESSYDAPREDSGGSLTIWEWNGFGFSLFARQEGWFQKLSILQEQSGNIYLMTYP